jgi:hypothetical protein
MWGPEEPEEGCDDSIMPFLFSLETDFCILHTGIVGRSRFHSFHLRKAQSQIFSFLLPQIF